MSGPEPDELEPVRGWAELRSGPYDFERFPDDLDTLQRDGSTIAGSVLVDVTWEAYGAAITVTVPLHRAQIQLSPAECRHLAARLVEISEAHE